MSAEEKEQTNIPLKLANLFKREPKKKIQNQVKPAKVLKMTLI